MLKIYLTQFHVYAGCNGRKVQKGKKKPRNVKESRKKKHE